VTCWLLVNTYEYFVIKMKHGRVGCLWILRTVLSLKWSRDVLVACEYLLLFWLTWNCSLSQRIQLETALGPQRQKFVSIAARKLHLEQPWYHFNITREAADQALKSAGHRNGKFLLVDFKKFLHITTCFFHACRRILFKSQWLCKQIILAVQYSLALKGGFHWRY